MEFTGNLVSISRDWNTGKMNITFSINEEYLLNETGSFKDKLLNIKAVLFRKKRSLDSNAYLWVLCTKLAKVYETSKEEVYEQFIQDYAPVYEDEDGHVTITVKKSVDMSKIDGHWKWYKDSPDGRFSSYLMLKGSSKFDTKEMSEFLEQVVLTAKEEGIEVMPQDEIDRMNQLWERERNKSHDDL